MKKTRKVLIALLCALTVSAGTMGLAACELGLGGTSESAQNSESVENSEQTDDSEKGDTEDSDNSDTEDSDGSESSDGADSTEFEWNIIVQNASEIGLAGAVVTVKDGEDVIATKTTTDIGYATFRNYDFAFGNYTIEVTAPAGYELVDSGIIVIDGETEGVWSVNVAPTGKLPEVNASEKKEYCLGDVVYDYTLETTTAETVSFAQLLQEKDMILLNFWATWCAPCKAEFPYMNEAYEMYQDKAAVVTVTIDPSDSMDELTAYKNNEGFSFIFAGYSEELVSAFKASAVPLTVIIDKNGVVSYIHGGSMTTLEQFTDIFAVYTHENYQSAIVFESNPNWADYLPAGGDLGGDIGGDIGGDTDDDNDDNGNDNEDLPVIAAYTLDYVDNGNGYTVVGRGNFPGGMLLIPETYEGQAVTAVAEGAFMGATDVYAVIIPDSVTSLGMGAFSGCININRIEVGTGLTEAWSAFDGCNKVVEICDGTYSGMFFMGDYSMYGINAETVKNCYMRDMGTSGLTMDSNGFVTYQAQPSAMAPEMPVDSTKYLVNYVGTNSNVVIPNGIDRVGMYAFSGNSAVQSIVVPESVTYVEKYAFTNTTVQNISLPASLTTLASDALDGCTALAAVEVAANNPSYTAIDGNLYNKAGTTLVRYMPANPATEYVTPDTVTEIGWKAFKNIQNLQKVTIGENVTKVNTYAFNYNACLKEVVILGATSFGTEVFASSSALEKVTVAGAAELGKGTFKYCKALKTVSLADGVTFAGGDSDETYIFAECTALEEIRIPGSVTRIHKRAFEGCTALKKVVLEEGVKYICEDAFNRCKNFELVMPTTVTWVHRYGLKVSNYITALYYAGTEADLSGINYYLGGSINGITNNWYFYSEEAPTTEGNFWHYNNGEIEIWG